MFTFRIFLLIFIMKFQNWKGLSEPMVIQPSCFMDGETEEQSSKGFAKRIMEECAEGSLWQSWVPGAIYRML